MRGFAPRPGLEQLGREILEALRRWQHLRRAFSIGLDALGVYSSRFVLRPWFVLALR